MDVFDFIDMRLPVKVAGKAFEVRRLRLSDVLRITVRFDAELRAFASQEKPDAVQLLTSLTLQDTAELLAFSMEPYDPVFLREHIDLKTAVELTESVKVLNDVPRIWDSLKIGQAPEPEKAEPAIPGVELPVPVPPLVRVIDRLAARYGVDPMTIPGWFYEAFLDLVEAADQDVKAKEGAALAALGVDPDLLDDSRIPAGPIADLNKLVN